MFIPNPFKMSRRVLKLAIAAVLIFAAWAVWTGRLSQNLDIDKKTVTLYDWPSQLENLKVIQLSDFHFDKSKSNQAAHDAINWAAKQDADLIVLFVTNYVEQEWFTGQLIILLMKCKELLIITISRDFTLLMKIS